MAKRFTDNEKWKKKFFRKLPMQYKLLWIYILDDCNHAGIWDVDIEVAEVRIGYHSFLLNELEEIFQEHIVVFKNGEKWFIPDFISFQYGTLNENSRVHQSVIQLLKRHNLYEAPIEVGMESEIKYIDIPKTTKRTFKKPSTQEVADYCSERKNNVDAEKFCDYYESKGWRVGEKSPMKCWKASVRTWEKNEKPKSKIDKNLHTWQNVKNLLK